MVPIITRVLIDHVCAAGMRQTVAGTWLGRGACWLRTSQRAGMETANLTHPVSGHLQHYVGKLFDAVRMAAADVVSLTGLEVANDIRQCRDGVRQISGCP